MKMQIAIKKSIENGKESGDIRYSMLANGWTESDVADAFQSLNIALPSRAMTNSNFWAPFFLACQIIVY